jgi:chromosome segregation ATPase
MSKETNDEEISAAMHRLLLGQPLYTDGRLTVSNLAKEAGLTRQQVYRSPERLAEFNNHVLRLQTSGAPPVEKHLAKIAALQEELKDVEARAERYRLQRDAVRGERETLANQVLILQKMYDHLEEELAKVGKLVLFPLDRRK